MPEIARTSPSVASTRAGYILLALALVMSAVLSAHGITDESAVSLHGDMPRHMMNGVFLWDLLKSGSFWSVSGAMDYAREYFVRYPALSLGHHPPVVAVWLVPFYAVFGVSTFAARLAMVSTLLISVVALFRIARQLYGPRIAGAAALLLAVQPFAISFGQQVMTEGPTVAIVLLAIDALLRFRASGRARDYAWFVVLAALTLYAKQVAIFMFPTYALTLLIGAPLLRRRLFRRDIILLTFAGAILVAPIVIATFILSPYNMAVITGAPMPVNLASATDSTAPQSILPSIFQTQFALPFFIAFVGGAVVSVINRDRRALFAAFWSVSVVAGVALLIGPYEAPRYAIVAVPAYCLLAAASMTINGQWPRRAAIATVALAVSWNATISARIQPVGAGGYEAAAEYVASNDSAATLLYSAPIDTGYFVFFTRKHDVARQRIVLRADKMLTTSMMDRLSVEDLIASPEEIYGILDMYGTRLIVVEDRNTGSQPLEWLREELRGDRFTELRRFPIRTTDRRLIGVDIVIYEYRNAKPFSPDAEIDVDLPLIGRGIHLKLSDLIGSPAN